jgi:hypothetical protein
VSLKAANQQEQAFLSSVPSILCDVALFYVGLAFQRCMESATNNLGDRGLGFLGLKTQVHASEAEFAPSRQKKNVL